MSKLVFTSNDAFTVGIELELGIVDAKTMALANSVQQLLEAAPAEIASRIKPELMQCCIEINTEICSTIDQADNDLRRKLLSVQTVADELDLRLWWGSTHPFSHWCDQKVTQNERYLNLVELLQEMARRLVTNGLHVHVGVESGDKAVMICDRIMQYLPVLLALSTSSPFWEGRDTGLASHRSKIMEGLPTAGLPPLMRNWSEYVWLVNHMVDTGFINTIREIWWDVRPHHNFGTVEVRVCDMPGNLDDSLTISAMIQCLVKHLSDEIDLGAYQHDCHPMMVRQNKWRACRFGSDAKLVNSYTYEVESVSTVVARLIERLTPSAIELGCEPYLLRAQEIADRPTWADRQRLILKETGDPTEIVRRMTEQSRIETSAAAE
ncbi:YbdK family carboxylate-amine ligase [Blastopirellula sp. JC732]|uniref:Putative glutamate--cysteine ligase 2 n=1 Tax=Blastopirellula sediminis TaxID=2894196 RepID=A0A9X1MLX1_9BACT|nr:YbdK family carboxylate-amine ligase [Blastopirellula sediminis]MCC9607658.1 YbdK family carboxylate-amine ligase [Blastopirellula sediminis]MCC9629049.1 YbdK family carboxylate-amine ligase [Blastopirellula sediminis]